MFQSKPTTKRIKSQAVQPNIHDPKVAWIKMEEKRQKTQRKTYHENAQYLIDLGYNEHCLMFA